jgi:N-methylhydantoinase A
LEADKEVVNVRAVVQGEATVVKASSIDSGGKDASEAIMGTETIFVDDADQETHIYNRSKIKAGNRIAGPAIVVEMDATTLILPGHTGEVDKLGNILIRPDEK